MSRLAAPALLSLIVPLNQLLNLVNIGTLIAFAVVCSGVLYLRHRKPDIPRSFRVPFVPLFPILGIVFSLFLAVSVRQVDIASNAAFTAFRASAESPETEKLRCAASCMTAPPLRENRA